MASVEHKRSRPIVDFQPSIAQESHTKQRELPLVFDNLDHAHITEPVKDATVGFEYRRPIPPLQPPIAHPHGLDRPTRDHEFPCEGRIDPGGQFNWFSILGRTDIKNEESSSAIVHSAVHGTITPISTVDLWPTRIANGRRSGYAARAAWIASLNVPPRK